MNFIDYVQRKLAVLPRDEFGYNLFYNIRMHTFEVYHLIKSTKVL